MTRMNNEIGRADGDGLRRFEGLRARHTPEPARPLRELSAGALDLTDMASTTSAESESGLQSRPPAPERGRRSGRSNFRWGYLMIRAKFESHCEIDGCGRRIEKGRLFWWHPQLRAVRCFLCPPDRETKQMDDQILWYVSLTDEEYKEYCADDDVEDEWEAIEEPDPGLGVRVWDEDENEDERDQTDKEEENSLFKPLLRRDVRRPRNLTSPNEIAALSFSHVLLDLRPMLEHLVWRILRRYGYDYRLERDDMMGEAQLGLYRATQRFEGRSMFGSFVSVVVENALTDYVRKQSRAPEPVAEIPDQADDPTEAWIAQIDLARALVQVPNSHLLLWHAAGVLDRELGVAEIVCVRRYRAREKVRALLAADRASSQES
jgi:hypothetical protein